MRNINKFGFSKNDNNYNSLMMFNNRHIKINNLKSSIFF